MTRILVTGSSGLLGLNLCLQNWQSHSLIGVDRGKLLNPPFELFRADLAQAGTIAHLVETLRPDAIIHTAANANLEACQSDPQGALYLNAVIPGQLAEACAKHSIQLLHISTDAVFDGTGAGVYTEDDLPNPLSVYAQTKLAGENQVLSTNPGAMVARVNFFGWSLSGTRSLSEFFYNRLSAGQQCNGFTDVYFCPMFVGDLAATLLKMLAKNLSGLYHVVGSESLSKFDFGQRIARQFGYDPDLVIPRSVEDSGLNAPRSHNLRLSIHKLSTALGDSIPTLSTGIEQFYTQAQQAYPQKMRGYAQV